MRKAILFITASLLSMSLQACNHSDPACCSSATDGATCPAPKALSTPAPATQPSTVKAELPGKMTWTGKLASNVPNNTGQTQWTLIGDRGAGGMNVDISHIRDGATALDGKRVEIIGHMAAQAVKDKPTIVADQISAAAESNGAAR